MNKINLFSLRGKWTWIFRLVIHWLVASEAGKSKQHNSKAESRWIAVRGWVMDVAKWAEKSQSPMNSVIIPKGSLSARWLTHSTFTLWNMEFWHTRTKYFGIAIAPNIHDRYLHRNVFQFTHDSRFTRFLCLMGQVMFSHGA